MTDIYTFINKGLEAFHELRIAGFSDDVFESCKNLNELLNAVSPDCKDYDNHLDSYASKMLKSSF